MGTPELHDQDQIAIGDAASPFVFEFRVAQYQETGQAMIDAERPNDLDEWPATIDREPAYEELQNNLDEELLTDVADGDKEKAQ